MESTSPVSHESVDAKGLRTRDSAQTSHPRRIINGPRREKTCLWWFANNTGADQPAHSRSLISAFVIHLLESILSKLATSEISNKFLDSLCS